MERSCTVDGIECAQERESKRSMPAKEIAVANRYEQMNTDIVSALENELKEALNHQDNDDREMPDSG